MRRTELRINNIVKYHNDDTIFRVIRIDELGIGVENKNESTWI